MAKVAKRVMYMMTMLLFRVKWRGAGGLFEVACDTTFAEIPPRSMATKRQCQMQPVAHNPPTTRVTEAANETAVVMSDWRGA
jgi:hypothetical protein